MKIHAVILAGGKSSRFNHDVLKQFTNLFNRPVIEYCWKIFIQLADVKTVTFVLPENYDWQDYIVLEDASVPVYRAFSGPARAHSLLNAICVLKSQVKLDPNDWILIHDAVRPNIQLSLVHKFLNSIKKEPYGGILGVPIVDTVKRINDQGVVQTIDRNALYLIQTPQAYRFGILEKLLTKYYDHLDNITDESMLFEREALSIRLVFGARDNIKITSQRDLAWMEKHMNHFIE